MSTSTLPDLAGYELHHTVTDAAFESVAVPGLSAEFYRRPNGGRIAMGRYRMAGAEMLVAWGYVDEEHCRRSAVRDPHAGGWHRATADRPTVRVERDGDTGAVTRLAVRTPGNLHRHTQIGEKRGATLRH